MFFPNKKKVLILFMITAFLIIADRILKLYSLSNFFSRPTGIIGEIVKFGFTTNYNIAFSLPIQGFFLNIIIIIIIFILIAYNILFFIAKREFVSATLLAAIILGAISNLFDRLRYGFVIDYFDLKYFTVFNLADAVITGGVLGIIWLKVRSKKPSRKKQNGF